MSDSDSNLYKLIDQCNKEIDRIITEKENFIRKHQQHQQKIDYNLQDIINNLKELEDENDIED